MGVEGKMSGRENWDKKFCQPVVAIFMAKRL